MTDCIGDREAASMNTNGNEPGDPTPLQQSADAASSYPNAATQLQ